MSTTNYMPPKPILEVSTAITEIDHGPIVVLVAWLCFTAGILLSVVRAYIRWPLHALAGKDDIAYAVSTVFAIVQTAITLRAVRLGFGEKESELDPRQVSDIERVSAIPSPKCESILGHATNKNGSRTLAEASMTT